MKIQLLSRDKEYGFNIVSDSGKSLFFSPSQFFLNPDISPNYNYAWEAYRDAIKMIKNKPYHLASEEGEIDYDADSVNGENSSGRDGLIDVSAETMLVSHYDSVLEAIKFKAKEARKSKEDRKKIFQEAKLILKELSTISKKLTDNEEKLKIKRVASKYKKLIWEYFPEEARKDVEEERRKKEKEALPPPDLPTPEEAEQISSQQTSEQPMQLPGLASSNFEVKIAKIMDPESDKSIDFKEELMEEYSEKICLAIQDKHPSAYCHYESPESNELVIMENEKPIIVARMNKYFGIDSISPSGKLRKIFPLHSSNFYHRYWKPIVKSIKHFCTSNPSILVITDGMTLPDKGDTNILNGWDIENKKFDSIDIGFRDDESAWVISACKISKKASSKNISKYDEQEYINAIVKCIDPNLKEESIFGKTGAAIQVIPGVDMIEIDVDFGRGLGIVRLTEKQIEIVPI